MKQFETRIEKLLPLEKSEIIKRERLRQKELLEETNVTQKEVNEVFDYACEQLHGYYMYMGKRDGKLQFKHRFTRQYIEIPDWENKIKDFQCWRNFINKRKVKTKWEN